MHTSLAGVVQTVQGGYSDRFSSSLRRTGEEESEKKELVSKYE